MSIKLVNCALFTEMALEPIHPSVIRYRVEGIRPEYTYYYAKYGVGTTELTLYDNSWVIEGNEMRSPLPVCGGQLIIDGITIYDETDSSLPLSYNWTPVDGAVITFSEYTTDQGVTLNRIEIVTGSGGGMTDVLTLNNKPLELDGVVLGIEGSTPPVTSETWVINEEPAIIEPGFESQVGFVSNGTDYTQFEVIVEPFGAGQNIWYDRERVYDTRPFPFRPSGWTGEAYRTITLDEPATGDFLTWLQENAVKQ